MLPRPLDGLVCHARPPSNQDSQTSVQGVRIPRTEAHELIAEELDQTYEVWIAHPEERVFGGPAGPPLVVYLLDADMFFGTVVEMTRIMHSLFGELPPILVVGLAYPGDDRAEHAALRARDFTPTTNQEYEKKAAAMAPGREPFLKEGERYGKADAFRRFLLGQVQPWVKERFEIREEGETLIGSSLGGLFVAHTLLSAPGSFSNYVAISPALWWDNDYLFSLDRPSPPTRERKAYLAVGGHEEDPRVPQLASFKMIGNVHRLEQELDSNPIPGLRVHKAILDGETHTSVVPVAVTRGLRYLFGRS